MEKSTIEELEAEGSPLIRTGEISNRGDKDKEIIQFDDYLDDTTVTDFKRIPTYKRMCICYEKMTIPVNIWGLRRLKKN